MVLPEVVAVVQVMAHAGLHSIGIRAGGNGKGLSVQLSVVVLIVMSTELSLEAQWGQKVHFGVIVVIRVFYTFVVDKDCCH